MRTWPPGHSRGLVGGGVPLYPPGLLPAGEAVRPHAPLRSARSDLARRPPRRNLVGAAVAHVPVPAGEEEDVGFGFRADAQPPLLLLPFLHPAVAVLDHGARRDREPQGPIEVRGNGRLGGRRLLGVDHPEDFQVRLPVVGVRVVLALVVVRVVGRVLSRCRGPRARGRARAPRLTLAARAQLFPFPPGPPRSAGRRVRPPAGVGCPALMRGRIPCSPLYIVPTGGPLLAGPPPDCPPAPPPSRLPVSPRSI